MALIKTGTKALGKNLQEQYSGYVKNHGPEVGEELFRANFSKLVKKHGYNRFSVKGLAEGIFGEQWDTKYRQGCMALQRGLMESQAAIDVSAFSNITGQLLVDRIRDNFEGPLFVADQLFETIPVANGNLGTHREPWLSRIKDAPTLLQPQQEYPETSFVEQYIDLPALEKRGEKVSVSMEAIFSDLTKQIYNRCDDVGYRLRYDKEERQMKVVAGIVNNWKYMGTGYNTYATSGLYINKVSGVTITNYSHVSGLELLFSNMVDFVTGKSIMIDPSRMKFLVTPAKIPEMKIALHSSKTKYGPFATSGVTIQTEINDVPLINDHDYPIIKSNVLHHLLTGSVASGGQAISAANAKEYVFFGDFQKAFVYREAMPFTTKQAPPGNPAEFNQDIVLQVKAMEWGVAGVQSPQNVLWSYQA